MEGSVTYFPLRRVSPRGRVVIVEGGELLHTITDITFGSFKIHKRPGKGRRGFWETHPAKLDELVRAFKTGDNIENACIRAGISHDSFEDFMKEYPQFGVVKRACEAFASLDSMVTVRKSLQENPHLAYKYLKDRNDFNFDSRNRVELPPLQPTVAVAVQVNNHTNDRAIEDRARIRLAERLSQRRGEGQSQSGRVVA